MFTFDQLQRAEMTNYQLHLVIERSGFTLLVKLKGVDPMPVLTTRGVVRVFKSLDALYAALDALDIVPSKIEMK